MIRGIPKEGWKRAHRGRAFVAFAPVMIRGIPKEGWKLAYRSLSASFIAIYVGQKSLNGDVKHQISIRTRLFLFFWRVY
jgi:hypothetical protein